LHTENMDYLWSPWRYRYVSQAVKSGECPFCLVQAIDPAQDRERLVLFRGSANFVLLNLYPYTTGHLMIIPYAHVAILDLVPPETLCEMMGLARTLQTVLQETYHPEGYNLGMNLGRCAGAGVADHLHLHLLPRWVGDLNFMTVIGETRVHPEDLLSTYDKLAAGLAALRKANPEAIPYRAE
jgi:ATP adenylyltransferase